MSTTFHKLAAIVLTMTLTASAFAAPKTGINQSGRSANQGSNSVVSSLNKNTGIVGNVTKNTTPITSNVVKKQDLGLSNVAKNTGIAGNLNTGIKKTDLGLNNTVKKNDIGLNTGIKKQDLGLNNVAKNTGIVGNKLIDNKGQNKNFDKQFCDKNNNCKPCGNWWWGCYGGCWDPCYKPCYTPCYYDWYSCYTPCYQVVEVVPVIVEQPVIVQQQVAQPVVQQTVAQPVVNAQAIGPQANVTQTSATLPADQGQAQAAPAGQAEAPVAGNATAVKLTGIEKPGMAGTEIVLLGEGFDKAQFVVVLDLNGMKLNGQVTAKEAGKLTVKLPELFLEKEMAAQVRLALADGTISDAIATTILPRK